MGPDFDRGTGALILSLSVLPYVIEVVVQLRLQALFVGALLPAKRAALPPHPREPWLVFLGSLRFQLAFWRYVRLELPDDPLSVTELKRRMLASLRRELIWALLAITVFVFLLGRGWSPFQH